MRAGLEALAVDLDCEEDYYSCAVNVDVDD